MRGLGFRVLTDVEQLEPEPPKMGVHGGPCVREVSSEAHAYLLG